MLQLIIDTFILVVLIRLISGEENENFLMAGLVALLASLGLVATSVVAMNVEDYVLTIIFGGIVLVGFLVSLGCFAMLGVPFKKSLIIGGSFMLYKIVFSILWFLLFAL